MGGVGAAALDGVGTACYDVPGGWVGLDTWKGENKGVGAGFQTHFAFTEEMRWWYRAM